MANENYAFSWDDDLSFDALPRKEFVLLDPGTYTGKVTKFERIQWGGSAKIPKGTNTARLTIEVETATGTAVFTDDLPLWSSVTWKISGMFVCFGLRKHGDQNTKMPWTELVGCTGMIQVGQREWEGSDGKLKYSNTVEKYLDKPASGFTPVTTADEEFPF